MSDRRSLDRARPATSRPLPTIYGPQELRWGSLCSSRNAILENARLNRMSGRVGSLELLPPPRRVGGSLGTIPKRASREGGVRVQSASIVHEFAVLKSARETEKTGLSVGHAARCFEVFDQLIPELGVHARPAKTLRDELWDMVHSDEFTATPEFSHPVPLPYFELVRRMRKQRIDERAMDSEERASSSQRIEQLERELESTKASLVASDVNGSDMADMLKLKEDLERARSSAKSLASTHAVERFKLVAELSAAQKHIQDLTAHVDELKKVVEQTAPHKNAFDRAAALFDQPFVPGPGLMMGLLGNCKAGQVVSASAHTRLLDAKNALLDELEKRVAEHGGDDALVRAAKDWPVFEKRYRETTDAIIRASHQAQEFEHELGKACATLASTNHSDFEIEGKFFVNEYCAELVKAKQKTTSEPRPHPDLEPPPTAALQLLAELETEAGPVTGTYRPRHLSLPLVSSIVRDFVTWVDALVNETDEESQVVPTRHRRSACAYFLIFLSTRYMDSEIAVGVARDVFLVVAKVTAAPAVPQDAMGSVALFIFNKVLLGELSLSALLLHRVRTAAFSDLHWGDVVGTAHSVFSVSFPFLDQDGLENQQLTLQGFCSNVHSELATSEYFGFLIWDHRDPSLQRLTSIIKHNGLREEGRMGPREFVIFAMGYCSSVSMELAHRIFRYLQLSGAGGTEPPRSRKSTAKSEHRGSVDDKDHTSIPVEHCATAAAFLEVVANRQKWAEKVDSNTRFAATTAQVRAAAANAMQSVKSGRVAKATGKKGPKDR